MSCLYLRFLDGLHAGRKAGGGGRLSLPGWRTGRQPDRFLFATPSILRFFVSSILTVGTSQLDRESYWIHAFATDLRPKVLNPLLIAPCGSIRRLPRFARRVGLDAQVREIREHPVDTESAECFEFRGHVAVISGR